MNTRLLSASFRIRWSTAKGWVSARKHQLMTAEPRGVWVCKGASDAMFTTFSCTYMDVTYIRQILIRYI
eukprot:6172726-Pleurochrysis_carterae.AAC.1